MVFRNFKKTTKKESLGSLEDGSGEVVNGDKELTVHRCNEVPQNAKQNYI